MKKIIFSLLAVVLFAACGDKAVYTVSGVTTDAADGTKVYLFEDRRGQIVLDTSTVQNGKFEFVKKPIVPEQEIVFFGVEGLEGYGSTSRPIEIFIEAGDIVLTMDSKIVSDIKGTPLNEKNVKFFRSLGEQGAPNSENIKEYIKANSDNILGVYYLNKYAFAFELEELKSLLPLFPAKYDNNEILNRVRENVKIQEETAVGAKFKDIKGLSPEGEELALSQFAGQGKIVLVDFWASWCGPCRRDMPFLVDAYAKYKDKGFEIVGVSLDKTKEDWVKGISDLNITWPQISDLKYWESDLSKAYAVRSIPYTVLIDAEGNIIGKQIEGKDLEAKLAELLK